jgi:threonine/homoserine/homoserine lactone efflux protein
VIISIMACVVIMMDGFDQAPWDTWSIINLGLLISAVVWSIVAIWAGLQKGKARKRSVPLWLRVVLIFITAVYVLGAARFAFSYLFAQNLTHKADDLPQVNNVTTP